MDTSKLQSDDSMCRQFGQKMGYEIPTCQMQHDAADENLTNKIQALYTLQGTVVKN